VEIFLLPFRFGNYINPRLLKKTTSNSEIQTPEATLPQPERKNHPRPRQIPDKSSFRGRFEIREKESWRSKVH
jgi:hypothetical protein